MNGIAVDTFEAFDSLTELQTVRDIPLQIDADVFNDPSFTEKFRKLYCDQLIIRNPVPPRLNRLILDSTFKLQLDYLASLGKEIENYQKFNVKKILIDFDMPSVLQNGEKCDILKKILTSIKGMTYSENIETELLFRLPFNNMEDFIASAALFRQNSMLGLNYAIDMHIHEAGFNIGELEELLLPIRFDISSVNFVYDAALGNKINPQNLKKIMDSMLDNGTNCNFFLCPSGSINFLSIYDDLQEWLNIDEYDETESE